MNEQRQNPGRRIEDERCGDCKAVREQTHTCLNIIKASMEKMDAKMDNKVSRFTLKVAIGMLSIILAAFTWQFAELRIDLKSLPMFNATQMHVVKTLANIEPDIREIKKRIVILEEIKPDIEMIKKKIDRKNWKSRRSGGKN